MSVPALTRHETECRCCGEPTVDVFGPGLCGQCAEELDADLDDQRRYELRGVHDCNRLDCDTCHGRAF